MESHIHAIFGRHLEKRKNTFTLETVRDRAILMKFLTYRVSAECTGDIHKNHFIFYFCVKCKNAVNIGNKILAAILNFGGN